MKQLMHMELKKAFRNPWFVVAFFIALALALASATCNIIQRRQYGVHQAYDYRYVSPSPDSCYRWWISLDFLQPTSTLFFQLLPLLAVIPYAWSLRTEMGNGYIAQVVSRQRRIAYYIAKGLAVFLSGAVVAVGPLMANFLVLACFVPAYQPDIVDVIYLGVYPEDLWSWFFYNHPLLYVLLYTMLAGVLCGLWALSVHSLSFVAKNRVALLAIPYLGLLGIQFISDRIYLVLGAINGVQLGLSANMRAGQESYLQSGWVILAEGVALLALSLALTGAHARKDLL